MGFAQYFESRKWLEFIAESNAKSKQDDCKAVSTFLDKEWQAICIMHVAATELLIK